MWHVGMRPIGKPSPGLCGSAQPGFGRPGGLIPMSPGIRSELSARDGGRDAAGDTGSDPGDRRVNGDLSPRCRR